MGSTLMGSCKKVKNFDRLGKKVRPVAVTPLHPVHLSRVSLLRVLKSNFPGDPLSNSTDMRIPTPEN